VFRDPTGLANSDRTILVAPTKCVEGFNEALRYGKSLVTLRISASLVPRILTVVSRMRSATSLLYDFRFFVLTDAPPDKTTSALLDFCDCVTLGGVTSIRTLMSFPVSSLPASYFEPMFTKSTCFWRRAVFMLAFFATPANAMAQPLFLNAGFNKDNLELMIRHVREIERPPFANLGPLFVSSLYCANRTRIRASLLRMREVLFEEVSVALFDRYEIPAVHAPGHVQHVVSGFPLVDGRLPPGSTHHYQKYEEMQWRGTRFGRFNFTSVELKPVSGAAWYLEFEQDVVSRRFPHNQHRFDRGLRLLLQKLTYVAPVVDLSLMFYPDRVFALLKHRLLVPSGCDPARVVFLLVAKETELSVENLVLINADCEDDGMFEYRDGSRMLRTVFIRVTDALPPRVGHRGVPRLPEDRATRCCCSPRSRRL